MNPTRTTPDWRITCRRELEKINSAYAVVFDARWNVLGEDASPATIAKHLKTAGYEWAPTERTVRRWLATIREKEREHKQASGHRCPL